MMSIVRGIVSVAYVTVGRVKHRRFSGPEVVPATTVPDLMTQLNELTEQVRQVGVNSDQRIQQEPTSQAGGNQ